MQRKIIKTGDGSTTIQLVEWDEQYHSIHGALQEALHVFIKMGLDYKVAQPNCQMSLSILEIGFGTGLNAFLTCIASAKANIGVHYEGVEAFPVEAKEIEQLNYIEQIKAEAYQDVFTKMHNSPWEESVMLTESFSLKKRKQTFESIVDVAQHDLIYFDAFGARVQPELWGESIFEIMFTALKPGGVLVTYAAKGSVRRAMLAVGFKVERLPGPPGKREMLRALKV